MKKALGFGVFVIVGGYLLTQFAFPKTPTVQAQSTCTVDSRLGNVTPDESTRAACPQSSKIDPLRYTKASFTCSGNYTGTIDLPGNCMDLAELNQMADIYCARRNTCDSASCQLVLVSSITYPPLDKCTSTSLGYNGTTTYMCSDGFSDTVTGNCLSSKDIRYQAVQRCSTRYSCVAPTSTPTATPTVTLTPTPTRKTPPCSSYGDVDGNGFVEENDAQLVLQFLSAPEQVSPEQKERADVNNDNILTMEDSRLILGYIAGEETTFRACTTPNLTCDPNPNGESQNKLDRADYDVWLAEYSTETGNRSACLRDDGVNDVVDLLDFQVWKDRAVLRIPAS